MGRRWLLATPLGVLLPLALGCVQQERERAPQSCREWQLLYDRLGWTGVDARANDTSFEIKDSCDQNTVDSAARGSLASVVQIRVCSNRQAAVSAGQGTVTTSSSGGTGIVVRQPGLVLTNAHVVDQAKEIVIVAPDRSEHRVARRAIDPKLDLALLLVESLGCPAASCSPTTVCRGQAVAAVGHRPLGHQAEVRTGRVLRATATLQNQLDPAGTRCYQDLIEDTALVEPGFSGGPLIDTQGRLVGINVAAATPPGARQRYGYAIPLNTSVLRSIDGLAEQLAVEPHAD